MQAIKNKSIDVETIGLSILENIDKEAKEEIWKEKYASYHRRNKTSPNQPKTCLKNPLPLDTNAPSPKVLEIKLNIDLVATLSKLNVHISFNCLRSLNNMKILRDSCLKKKK